MTRGIDYSGQTLDGRYRLVRKLGQGGMGAVYLGQHAVLGKRVAVKILHAALASSGDVLKRFYREAQAAAAIGHKNIIDVIDVGASPQGDPYIVMEYLEGEDLDSMLERSGPLDLPSACGILEQALLALAAAHEKDIIHRDLKPANIFLLQTEEGEPLVKLIDFGISKFTSEDQVKLTQTGSLLGTPAYMSPEQASGDTDIDRRADLYSMGVILYQMLTGRLPFEGRNYNALLAKILTEEPTPPSEIVPQLPTDVDTLLMRELSKNPEHRSQSAAELLAKLEQIDGYHQRTSGLTMLASGIVHRTLAAGDLGERVATSGDSPSATGVLAEMAQQSTPSVWADTGLKESSRRVGLRVGLLALAAVVAAGLAVFVFTDLGRAPAPQETLEPTTAPAETFVQGAERGGVEINVEGAPAGAIIYYDKAEVPFNPFRVELRDTLAQIKVEAPGFEPFVTSLVPSEDQTIQVSLVPVATEPGSADTKSMARPKAADKPTAGADSNQKGDKPALKGWAEPPAKTVTKTDKGTLYSDKFE